MSAPILWIGLPVAAGAVALALRRYGAPLYIGAGIFNLFLTWTAWQIPVDEPLEWGLFTIEIGPSLLILGRSFTILDADRPLVVVFYLALTLWMLGGFFVRPGRLFVGLAQIIVALLLAALSVDPFLYAAMLIAVAVLLSVPMLLPPGSKPGSGILRYVNFQLFGAPFILFVGWLLTGVEASPSNLSLVLRAGILIGLGFAFLHAVFPLHSWIPMLMAESHPFVAGYLLLFLPITVSLFGLSFLDRYAWMRETELVFDLLLAIGGVISLVGGAWAAVERHLGRQMGFAIVFEIGLSLLAIGVSGLESVQFVFALFLPRVVVVLVWALALAGFWQATDGALDMKLVKRVVADHPLLLAGGLLAIFSAAGLPLSAGFAPKFALLGRVWELMPWAAWAGFAGMLGLFVAGSRVLIGLGPEAFARAEPVRLGDEQDEPISDVSNPYAWLYLLVGGGGLLLMGLFPQLILGNLGRFLGIFPQLGP